MTAKRMRKIKEIFLKCLIRKATFPSSFDILIIHFTVIMCTKVTTNVLATLMVININKNSPRKRLVVVLANCQALKHEIEHRQSIFHVRTTIPKMNAV